MSKDYNFGNLRLKRDTIEFLKDMKEAFEASYGRKFTMDEFIRTMADSVESGDPGVWEIYCTMQYQKDQLKEKIEASQRMREEKDKVILSRLKSGSIRGAAGVKEEN